MVGGDAVEEVHRDDERDAEVLEVVDGREAFLEAAGVDEDDCADRAADQLVPEEPEAVLAGGAEEVEGHVGVDGDPSEVHGDGGAALGAGEGAGVVDAEALDGHLGFGA